MGSTGTGNFDDYSGTPGGTSPGGGPSGGRGATGTRCDNRIDFVDLQEVATSDYYSTRGAVPAPGTDVGVRRSLVGGRMGVETTDTSEVVGLLPTTFNYLRQCLEQGYTYSGQVSASLDTPVPQVRVDLEPSG